MTMSRSEPALRWLPDPGRASTLDEIVEGLRLLKVWAGDPSYSTIKDRINTAWKAAGRADGELARRSTVVDCFKTGRQRIKNDLVIAVVQALYPDMGYVTQWRQALRIAAGETRAASQVRVQSSLPPEMSAFTGRTAALDRLRSALHRASIGGDAVVISGMPGAGKTKLAVHAGHLLAREKRVDRILFVNLRGFHPDASQPPADPAAVLDGFLRLMGMPGHQIPHDLPARAAAYRARLAGTRTLVVLDNAVDADQVRPLLAEVAGCPVLVTSRRDLAHLRPTTHLAVGVFTPDEALEFLTQALPDVPMGSHPDAAARIACRCGYLPLALGLIAGHIHSTPGWTLTDHADRLDECHHHRRLDTGMQLALDLSYQQLPVDEQRLLRRAALHPGQDFDAYAAAALAETDLRTAQAHLGQLCRDHLLQQAAAGRYTFHDLIRAYAIGRARDEDAPPDRHDALTRLFDFYLSTAATTMDTLHTAETHRRPRIPPAATPVPDLTDPDTARTWLDTERPTLVAVIAHTATRGWPAHTTRLSTTLFRYLAGGRHTDATTVYRHAHQAAQVTGDLGAQANALANLGGAYSQLGHHESAAENLQQALLLFRRTGDRVGQARALNNLGVIEAGQGRYQLAADHYEHALDLHRQTGDRTGEARALGNLGNVEERLGRYRLAADHQAHALTLYRQAGDRTGEATALNDLGGIEGRLGRHGPAADHLQQAFTLFQQVGDRTGEAWVLDSLGRLYTRLGQPTQATQHHQRALAIYRESGDREGEAWALNGLGEAISGQPAAALAHHSAAHTIARRIGARYQQARADTGLGHAHRSLGNPVHARRHYQHALTLYTDLGTPHADEIRAYIAAIEPPK